MNEFLLTLFSCGLGAAITWFFSWFCYVRAGKELTHEAGELRKLTILMLRGMENAGMVEWNRDPSGNPIGLVFTETGGAAIKASGSGKEVVTGPGSGALLRIKDSDAGELTEESLLTKMD